MLKGLINIMETSWKKIILRFCIIVIIIFSASYVVGEYREYKEQQEIGTQLEREEVSTEVRNEVLTGKGKPEHFICLSGEEAGSRKHAHFSRYLHITHRTGTGRI